MPNWVNNRIIFSEDIPQEKFEAMLLGVLREEKRGREISDVRLSVSEVKALSDEEKLHSISIRSFQCRLNSTLRAVLSQTWGCFSTRLE